MLEQKLGRFKLASSVLAVLMILQFAVTTAIPASASGSSDTSFASGAFRRVWEQPDYPISAQKASRSYTWGPEGWAFTNEPYVESPGGTRLVQYFDKTRMEITNPAADPNDPYYVTNGLLVTEMVSGQLQLGNNKFQKATPSEVPVAGDAVNNPSPTYRSFQGIASLNLDHKAERTSGQVITSTVDRDGKVANDPGLAQYNVKNLEFDTNLSHNIPDVFWNFMNQQGMIYQSGIFTNGPVINWITAMGYPITEPYWSKVVVGGQTKDVLIQLYQRRVLTFTPSNPDAFKVEMGNVGAHYYAWRYPGKDREAHWALLQIINGSDCGTFTLNFSGQDVFSVDIVPGETKNLKMGPGKYHYTETGCGALPNEVDRTLDPDSNSQIVLTLT